MNKIFDQLSKALLAAMIDSVTTFETNREIRGHVLEAPRRLGSSEGSEPMGQRRPAMVSM